MKNFLSTIKRYINSEWYNLKNYHKIKLMTLLLIIILFPLTIPLAIVGFLSGMVLELIYGKKECDKSPYRLVKNKSYFTTVFNKGDIAEYFTWKILNNQPEYKKILINLYITNGKRTSEIDSILINMVFLLLNQKDIVDGFLETKQIIIGHKLYIVKKRLFIILSCKTEVILRL